MVVRGVKPPMCYKSRVCRAWKELGAGLRQQFCPDSLVLREAVEAEAIGDTNACAYTPQNMANDQTLNDSDLNINLIKSSWYFLR